MADIDVGSSPTNRDAQFGQAYTAVCKENPANFSGKVTQVQMWAQGNLADCEVATFFIVSGNNLSTRDSAVIGSVVAGAVRTFAVDLDVVVGDFIGYRASAGYMEAGASGDGIWYAAGDQIPCINQAFTWLADDTISISLYGTGLEPPAITSLTPDSGKVGAEVVIAGTDFEATQGTGGVTVGGVAATETAWADTEITITIPAGVTSGEVDVVVTTAHAQVSSAATFTVSSVVKRWKGFVG